VPAPAPPPARRLTIGELAGLAGVSTRTVRHYHAVGLLPEPERDASGYRRYEARDVVNLVRVVRLRALGMPIPRIAAQLDASESAGLQQLADELAAEIARLSALHGRLVDLMAGADGSPTETVAAALRDAGRLAPGQPLDAAEAAAVELVDALHPAGAAGALEAMAPVLADPARAERLADLIRQVRELDDGAGDERLDRLAGELVAVLGPPAPARPPLELAVLEKLLGHRLTDVQRRFAQRMRAALAAR
jgi:DNA-binding transcriptional MerR regulator